MAEERLPDKLFYLCGALGLLGCFTVGNLPVHAGFTNAQRLLAADLLVLPSAGYLHLKLLHCNAMKRGFTPLRNRGSVLLISSLKLSRRFLLFTFSIWLVNWTGFNLCLA